MNVWWCFLLISCTSWRSIFLLLNSPKLSCGFKFILQWTFVCAKSQTWRVSGYMCQWSNLASKELIIRLISIVPPWKIVYQEKLGLIATLCEMGPRFLLCLLPQRLPGGISFFVIPRWCGHTFMFSCPARSMWGKFREMERDVVMSWQLWVLCCSYWSAWLLRVYVATGSSKHHQETP